MKKSTILVAMLAVVGALTVGKLTAGAAFAQEPKAKLMAQQGNKPDHDGEEDDDLLTARVSIAQAVNVATQRVKGYVNEAKLEKEKGKLIWSVGIVSPDGKQLAEVEVDATSGAFLKSEIENGEEGDGDGETDDDAVEAVRG